MKKSPRFVALDVHTQNITIGLAPGDGSAARLYGTIPNDLHALEKVFAKLRKAHPGTELRVCYEAGPTGFVLARRLGQLKIACTARPPTGLPIPFLLLGGRPRVNRLRLANLSTHGPAHDSEPSHEPPG